MTKHRDDWGLGELFEGVFGFGDWGQRHRQRWRGGRRRPQMFEAGELRLVILRLLKEQPRHGYDVMKALEERMAGCYAPSAGTVYPTLQLLEDQGLVRAEEFEGKRVYHITPAGEALLEERRSELDEIIDRVRETVRDFAGGAMGELNRAFGQVAARTFREAFRRGPSDPAVRRVAEILRRTAEEIEREWNPPAPQAGKEGT
jgi:DNA-binding PadR family transcriptional regulator